MSNSNFLTVSDPQVRDKRVIETNEPLVLVTTAITLSVLDNSAENFAHLRYTPDFRLRLSVAERLAIAERSLPNNYCFLIKECYRPLEIQMMYFDGYLRRVRETWPDLSFEEARREAAKYVAPPEYATHATGGAIDIVLLDRNKKVVDMGTKYDADPMSCANACYTYAENISSQAADNRFVLNDALHTAGFVNYPFEWWHFSFGDKYWAYITGADSALYGPIK